MGVAAAALSHCGGVDARGDVLCVWEQKRFLLCVLVAMFCAGTMVRGPMHSIFWALFGVNRPWPRTGGTVRPGYERVVRRAVPHCVEM